jgi:ATP-dependent 26S proteasome regulatory subunit
MGKMGTVHNMKEKLKERIKNILKANHPFVYIKTEEEREIIKLLKDIAKYELLFSFDSVSGIKWLNEENFEKDRTLRIRIKNQLDSIKPDFSEALSFIVNISRETKTLLAILSADTFLKDEDTNIQNIRFLANILNEIKEEILSLIIYFISNKYFIPSLIENDTLFFETEYPSRKEIEKILINFLENYNLTITDALKNEFITHLQGLTETEIDNLLHLCYTDDGKLTEKDIDIFIDYKKQKARKAGILEYIDVRYLDTNIGGLKNLKKWLEKKSLIFKNFDRAMESGVDIPKGMLLFGMPGCGKSLACKYTAKLFNLPLLRLDMGRIMGPYLGQSEENLYKAIKIAESIAPSILWIDEIEKALSGVQGNTSNDTLVRIFGTLLTWMQEKNKPVFVVATANDISNIPPEFLRKGRFDEIFFIDFPKKEAIEEIFKIHLEKRGKGQFIDKIDFSKILSSMKEGYSGADIEAIVSEVVERAFIDNKTEITTEDFLEVINKQIVKPVAEVLKDKIEALRNKYKEISALPAD